MSMNTPSSRAEVGLSQGSFAPASSACGGMRTPATLSALTVGFPLTPRSPLSFPGAPRAPRHAGKKDKGVVVESTFESMMLYAERVRHSSLNKCYMCCLLSLYCTVFWAWAL